MSHVNQFGQNLFDPFIQKGFRLAVMELVPADNFALPADSPPVIIMNPAGAIDVLMPAASAANKGLTFCIINASANAITLKTSADAAFTNAIVVAAGQSTWVTCTGSATAALGWRGHSAAGTQTSP